MMSRTDGFSLIIALAGFALADPALHHEVSGQEAWELSKDPVFELGLADGPPHMVFHDIRGAFLSSDGLIVVADGGSKELRVFTASGKLLTTFGRAGDGPGEFRAIGWAEPCGEEAITVYDFGRKRITKWSTSGELLDGFRVDGTDPGTPPYSVQCGPGGRFVVVGWPDFRGIPDEVGPYRFEVEVGLTNARGDMETIIGSFPGPERYRWRNNDGPRPLGKTTVARLGDHGVVVGTADSFEIQALKEDGDRRTIGRPLPVRRLTGDMLAAWKDSAVAGYPERMQGAYRRSLERHQFPDFLPAYSDFRIDRAGRIWIAHYGVPGDRTPTIQWDVFDAAQGAFLGTIELPRHFRPTDMGRHYVLGVTTDGMGVERVRRYEYFR